MNFPGEKKGRVPLGGEQIVIAQHTDNFPILVSDGDVVCVPRGHHPCGAPYGYDMYYLNVMAGPLRKWRFENDPDHDWIAKRDQG